ncbi:hypothetical protein [Keratinibaculum paraultunense]|uniref:hypothetical protein n=1 Tax=Keratinibaculum paraultunense TaxID=1278232 RepID=UPI0010511867|nr:hypothetical protein [Keratinibaculum paraultunense]QQY78894.1 hypothetical protein JL105_06750 [Keratinibaculum paraultunense]
MKKWIKELGEYVEYILLHLKPDDENIRYIKELLVTYGINPIIALEYKINDLEYEIKRINRL